MNRLTLISLQVLVAVVTLVFWHIASTTTLIGNPKIISFFFAEPLAVGKRMVQWFTEGSIWYHLGITLTEAALAFIIGSLGGVIIGFWFARKPLLAAVFDPYVKAANALPRVVLAPIFALWLGLGIWSKVALGVTLVFFIVFFNVYQGVKEVSPAVLSNALIDIEEDEPRGQRPGVRGDCWPHRLREIDTAQCHGGSSQAGAGAGPHVCQAAVGLEQTCRLSLPAGFTNALEDRDRQRGHRAGSGGHAAPRRPGAGTGLAR